MEKTLPRTVEQWKRLCQELWPTNVQKTVARVKKKQSGERTKNLPRTADKCPVQEPLNERQDSSKTEWKPVRLTSICQERANTVQNWLSYEKIFILKTFALILDFRVLWRRKMTSTQYWVLSGTDSQTCVKDKRKYCEFTSRRSNGFELWKQFRLENPVT